MNTGECKPIVIMYSDHWSCTNFSNVISGEKTDEGRADSESEGGTEFRRVRRTLFSNQEGNHVLRTSVREGLSQHFY